jgi:hypothetical protein
MRGILTVSKKMSSVDTTFEQVKDVLDVCLKLQVCSFCKNEDEKERFLIGELKIESKMILLDLQPLLEKVMEQLPALHCTLSGRIFSKDYGLMDVINDKIQCKGVREYIESLEEEKQEMEKKLFFTESKLKTCENTIANVHFATESCKRTCEMYNDLSKKQKIN